MWRKSNGISVMEISKSDWDLYKIKLPLWQEKYMEHLNCEYNDILNGSEKASEKFWKLAKRIQKDKKNAGVIVELDRKLAVKTIVDLLNDKIITYDDLKEFSSELKDVVNFFMQ